MPSLSVNRDTTGLRIRHLNPRTLYRCDIDDRKEETLQNPLPIRKPVSKSGFDSNLSRYSVAASLPRGGTGANKPFPCSNDLYTCLSVYFFGSRTKSFPTCLEARCVNRVYDCLNTPENTRELSKYTCAWESTAEEVMRDKNNIYWPVRWFDRLLEEDVPEEHEGKCVTLFFGSNLVQL